MRNLTRGQIVTMLILVLGYAGYYLCRVHLSVATPLLIEEFGKNGINKDVIGGIVSLGTLFYAFGKFANGFFADWLGGKRMFLFGMLGAILATVLFGLGGGIPIFTLAWVVNRAVQSAGWPGMVKVSSRWYSSHVYGSVMGIISLSYLFGDFLSRLFLGQLIDLHVGWRGLFFIAATILGVLFLVSLLVLKDSPEPESELMAGASEVHSEIKTAEPEDTPIQGLFKNPTFWVVCLLSLGFTVVRETFNTWTPQYLTEVVSMNKGDAAKASSLFPLFGGISVLVSGFWSDKLGKKGRALLIFGGVLLSVPALLGLAYVKLGSVSLALFALGAIAFLMLGPYSFLAGAIALDFGGKRSSATASGWIDGIGYLGGIFAGKGIGGIAEKQGWTPAFMVLAGVAVVTTVMAWWFFRRESLE